MLADVADTSRTVGLEKKGEYLSDEIRIYLALAYVLTTFGTRVVTITARPYLAPCRLFIIMIMATGTILQ